MDAPGALAHLDGPLLDLQLDHLLDLQRVAEGGVDGRLHEVLGDRRGAGEEGADDLTALLVGELQQLDDLAHPLDAAREEPL